MSVVGRQAAPLGIPRTVVRVKPLVGRPSVPAGRQHCREHRREDLLGQNRDTRDPEGPVRALEGDAAAWKMLVILSCTIA